MCHGTGNINWRHYGLHRNAFILVISSNNGRRRRERPHRGAIILFHSLHGPVRQGQRGTEGSRRFDRQGALHRSHVESVIPRRDRWVEVRPEKDPHRLLHIWGQGN